MTNADDSGHEEVHTVERTNLPNADRLIAYAREQGLDVSTTMHIEPAKPYGTTRMLPSHTSVAVRISLPCPEPLAHTALGLHIRTELLVAFFIKSGRKGSRPNFTGAERSSLSFRRQVRTLHRVFWEAEWMGGDARRYQRLAEKNDVNASTEPWHPKENTTMETHHRQKPRLIVNAGEIRDMWEHLRQDLPYPMRLSDGTEIEVVAGDPRTGEIGREHADLEEVRVRGTGL